MKEQTLYLDDKHNIVSLAQARWKVIHKYNDKGDLVEEIWIDLKK